MRCLLAVAFLLTSAACQPSGFISIPEDTNSTAKEENLDKATSSVAHERIWEGTLKQKTREHAEYEVTDSSTKTIEAILFVEGDHASYVKLQVWKHRPFLGHKITCHNMDDECFQQSTFAYRLAPFIDNNSPYRSRLAMRIQPHFGESLLGTWNIEISHALPDMIGDVKIKLVVRESTSHYWGTVIPVFIGIIVAACLLLLAWDLVWSPLTRVRVVREAEEPTPRTPFFTRMGQIVRERVGAMRNYLFGGGRTTTAAAEYSELNLHEEGDDEESIGEDDIVCRICRAKEPESDLFSPCNCRGTVKYVHRACLEEWRLKTTNPENMVRCSECKTPFSIVQRQTEGTLAFAYAGTKAILTLVFYLMLLETTLVASGWGLKGVIGLVTRDIDNIIWNPMNAYHHMLGLAVVLSLTLNWSVFDAFLKEAIHFKPLRVVFVVFSLVVEVIFGYLGHFFLWMFNSTIWEWQVHFCTGYVFFCFAHYHLWECIQNAYRRWRVRHRVEEVVETEREMEDVDAENPPPEPSSAPSEDGAPERSAEGATVSPAAPPSPSPETTRPAPSE